MSDLSHTAEEQAVVEAQLGRSLRGEWRVARRCHLGVPMAIENHPRLPDGSPFPTLYWLTCPILVKRTSTLEADGAMAALNDRLANDDALRVRFDGDVARYLARRDRLERLEHADVAGGGPDRVKCLHAHVAHELADAPNAIGACAVASTGWPDCVVPCVGTPVPEPA